jgi:hypothetical protein
MDDKLITKFSTNAYLGGSLITPSTIYLFADYMIISKLSSTIINHEEQIVRYSKITDLLVSKGIFSSSIIFTLESGKEIEINGLTKSDAERIKQLITSNS